MDDGTDLSNQTLDLGVPEAEFLEYAEIILLTCMVVIGGPLNVYCFCRSYCPWSKTGSNVLEGGHQRNRRSSKASGSFSTRSLSLRLHLTAANLFIIWFYGISQICWLFTYSWLAGDFMCRLVKFLHTFCFYLTSNIVVTIAIDRVYVTAKVDRPALPERSNDRWFRLIVCWAPWILAVASSVPQLFVWNVISPFKNLPGWQQCVNIWVTWKFEHADLQDTEQYDRISKQEVVYGLFHLVLVFWCPAFIVICSYAVIIARFRNKIHKSQLDGRRMQRSANIEQFRMRAARLHYQLETGRRASTYVEDPESEPSPAGRLTYVPIIINAPQIFAHKLSSISNNVAIQTLSRVKRRTVWASACISFAYVACWSPYNILELWRFLDPHLENRYLELLSNLIVLNAVVNPLIYDTNLSLR